MVHDFSGRSSGKFPRATEDGCGCALGAKGGPCSEQFSEAVVLFNLYNCLELSNDELDLVVLASIQAFTHSESVGVKRSRSPRCFFYYQSQPICRKCFCTFMDWVTHDFDGLKNTTRIMVSFQGFMVTLDDYLKTRFPRLGSKTFTHFCRTTSRKMQSLFQEGYPGLRVMLKSYCHPK